MANKKVISERNKRYHEANRDRINARHVELRANRKAGPDAIDWAMKKLVSDARRRAKAKGKAFALDPLEIERPTHCPVLGMKLVYQATGNREPNSASLDRIDSSKGYTQKNVWVISWRANQIKSDATLAELEQLFEALRKKAAGRQLDGRTWDEVPE